MEIQNKRINTGEQLANGEAWIELSHASAPQLSAYRAQLEDNNMEIFQEYKQKEFFMDDTIKLMGGSCGRFQLITTGALIIIFAIGSQFFYSVPFYQQYPALQCYDKNGKLMMSLGQSQLGSQYCDKEFACNKKQVDSFKIDWSHSYSIHNWMTNFDLICEEPYKIGLIGSISFLSFSIGSFFTQTLADTYGRKKTVVAMGMISPLGMLLLLYGPQSLTLINILMFTIGFTYNARSTGAYLYNNEFIEIEHRINVGIALFTFSGIIQIFSAFWFWYTKDQITYFQLIIVILLIAILVVQLLVPESPSFLNDQGKFDQLKKCLMQIGQINGIENKDQKVKYAIIRLRLKKLNKDEQNDKVLKLENEEKVSCKNESIFSNSVTRTNLISCCVIWSSGGFIAYCICYYSKYFPGNFYINYAVQGLSNLLTMWYMKLLSKFWDSVKTHMNILIYTMIVFTLIMMLFTETSLLENGSSLQTIIVAAIIFIISLNAIAIQNYGYHINTLLFPVSMRGQAYGITNLVSRPFASLSTLVVEYTKYPMHFVLPMAIISCFAVNGIKVVDFENTKKESIIELDNSIVEESMKKLQAKFESSDSKEIDIDEVSGDQQTQSKIQTDSKINDDNFVRL